MRLTYSSAAERDIKRALDYYKREAGARVAERFIAQLELKAEKILEDPESYRIVAKDLRCVNLDRFPYQIVYRRSDATTIQIVLVRHHKQHPDFGLNR